MGKYTNQRIDSESIIYHLRDIANELAEANRLTRFKLRMKEDGFNFDMRELDDNA